MQRFLQQHGSDIRGVLSGWDRIRFRGTLRRLANCRGLDTLLVYLGVRMKEFKAFVSDVSADVRTHIERVATAADRPLIYLNSWKTPKEEQARQIAARDGVQAGLNQRSGGVNITTYMNGTSASVSCTRACKAGCR